MTVVELKTFVFVIRKESFSDEESSVCTGFHLLSRLHHLTLSAGKFLRDDFIYGLAFFFLHVMLMRLFLQNLKTASPGTYVSGSLGTPSDLPDSLWALVSSLLFILSAQKGCGERPVFSSASHHILKTG